MQKGGRRRSNCGARHTDFAPSAPLEAITTKQLNPSRVSHVIAGLPAATSLDNLEHPNTSTEREGARTTCFFPFVQGKSSLPALPGSHALQPSNSRHVGVIETGTERRHGQGNSNRP